jgi:hypothetical protein
MDNKKNLKPELKEIYERVMSTKPSPRTPQQPTPPTPKPQPPTVTPESKEEETPPKNEPFLASSAPRPISDSGGFVFSSNQKAQPVKKEVIKNESMPVSTDKKEVEVKKGKKSNLLPIVITLMVVFTLVYTVFWAFFLGII